MTTSQLTFTRFIAAFYYLSFIVVMIAAHFSYKYIEIPARNKIKKLFGNA